MKKNIFILFFLLISGFLCAQHRVFGVMQDTSSEKKTLSIKEISNIPNLTGKPDVLKALQLYPGFRSQGELSSVTLVRGGNPGENLYLLDNTPLLYVHHIGGYMSVFNPDMIDGVGVYKAGFPAKYGERLSSIMNITQKKGTQEKIKGFLSVGITDLSFGIEGPSKLKNSSFIVTARKTFVDLYYLAITGLAKTSNALMMYGFHDINGKYTWAPNSSNVLSLNVYQGDDYLQLFSKPKDNNFLRKNVWGNLLVSLNWDHVFPSDVFLKTTLSYTKYRLKNINEQEIGEDSQKELISKQRQSSVQDVSLRADLSYAIAKLLNLKFGGKFSYLYFVPMNYRSSTNVEFYNIMDKLHAFEPVLYVSASVKPLRFFSIEAGLRGVLYTNVDMCNFSAEPRLDLNFYIDRNHRFNISAIRVSQNTQLLANYGRLTANEIYVPSGKEIPVSYSNQYAASYSASFFNGNMELEAGVFYKILQNLTTYKEGYSYTIGDIYWRDKLVTGGVGQSKGFEILLKKSQGKIMAFIAYSFSSATRQYSGINYGNTYNYEYDSPHTISMNVSLPISVKWSFSASWQFQSGLPYTPVIGRYTGIEEGSLGEFIPVEVFIYGDKNSKRMQNYHRLDIAFKKRYYTKKRNHQAEWTLGLYNVYNRKNPYYYYYAFDLEGFNETNAYMPIGLFKTSIFSILPMVSYKVWFGGGKKRRI